MSRLLICIVLSFAFMAVSADQGTALTYQAPIVINKSIITDVVPDMNDDGHIVWRGAYNGKSEIFLYNGITVQPIINYPTSISNRSPQINAKGQIVWRGHDGEDFEIYLYTDGVIHNISNNDSNDLSPIINDVGQVSWKNFDSSMLNIYLYNDGAAQKISSTPVANLMGDDHRMNNKGQVVWVAVPDGSSQRHIYLYSDGEEKIISGYNCTSPDINNVGQIVWNGPDGTGSYNDIYLYDDGVATNISNSEGRSDSKPKINDSGEIVWFVELGNGINEDEIALYSDKEISIICKVTYGLYNDLNINNKGHVAWWDFDNTPTPTKIHVYAYGDGETQRISTGGQYNKYPQLNESNQLVFLNLDPTVGHQILLANPGTQGGILNMLMPALINTQSNAQMH